MSVRVELIEQWREALIRKATSRLLESLENPIMTAITYDEAEAFVRALLTSYDEILEEKQ